MWRFVQWTDQEMRRMSRKVELAENRQVEMLHLFSRFLQNPGLLSQMLQAANKRLDGARHANGPGG